jgi:hypothetical protein
VVQEQFLLIGRYDWRFYCLLSSELECVGEYSATKYYSVTASRMFSYLTPWSVITQVLLTQKTMCIRWIFLIVKLTK